MNSNSRFLRHLALVLGVYFLFQNLLYLAVTWGPVLFERPLAWAFFPVSLAYTIIAFFVIFSFKKHFVTLEGVPLATVNLPNLLTLFRVQALPTMAFLFVLCRDYPYLTLSLLALTAMAFVTDFFDGYTARKWNLGTELGKILDSGSDYVILSTLTVIFVLYGVMPWWLVLLILCRLVFQALGMMFISLKFKRTFLHTTFLGKLSFFALMVFYSVEILVFFNLWGIQGSPWGYGIATLEVIIGGIMVISIYDKFLYFRKILDEEEKHRPD